MILCLFYLWLAVQVHMSPELQDCPVERTMAPTDTAAIYVFSTLRSARFNHSSTPGHLSLFLHIHNTLDWHKFWFSPEARAHRRRLTLLFLVKHFWAVLTPICRQLNDYSFPGLLPLSSATLRRRATGGKFIITR